MSAVYDDDRPGMMRVHVAHERASKAERRYTRAELNAHAAAATTMWTGHRVKHNLAWYMAQNGLIDRDGYLRDGFPGGAS